MLKIACVQLTSGAVMLDNIARIEALVSCAAMQGAQLIVTPENAFLMENNSADRVFYVQAEHPAIKASANMARRHQVWLLIGSLVVFGDEEKNKENAVSNSARPYNRSLLFNPNGEIVAQYDKIHLFDVEVGDGQTYRESAKVKAGNKAVLATTPWCKLGMTICYDLRFSQLYRALAKAGASIITVPAAFTEITGEAHWQVLLRARAIETGCFIVAPAQTGIHAGGRKTYGHSLIINPWGKILADGGVQEGVIVADIDLAEVEKIRLQLPSLQHDREFTFFSQQPDN